MQIHIHVCTIVFFQGKPTEFSKEAKIQSYGELEAKGYIPGAEVLEVEENAEEEDGQGTGKVFETFLVPFFCTTDGFTDICRCVHTFK